MIFIEHSQSQVVAATIENDYNKFMAISFHQQVNPNNHYGYNYTSIQYIENNIRSSLKSRLKNSFIPVVTATTIREIDSIYCNIQLFDFLHVTAIVIPLISQSRQAPVSLSNISFVTFLCVFP